MTPELRLGIDLGGSKIEIIALDRQGRTLLRQRCATPGGDYPGTLNAIRQLVQDCERQLNGTGTVGIGIPGTRSADHGLIKNANSTCLNGQPLQEDLETLLERPVRLANDADCLAVSEAADGAGSGAQCVFGVIIGTGVGGGLVINGQLLQGPNGISGEWGHNPLPWRDSADGESLRCYCGHQDCIETFLSGPGWARRSGLSCTARELAQRAAALEPLALQAVEHYCDLLARALASVINLIDPQVIVLGGGLSQMPQLYQRVPLLLPRHVFSDRVNTRLAKARHGDSSGVRGAAWLWP